MAEDTVQVFHRWNADLDVDARTVTFCVSKSYATSAEETEKIDPNNPEAWDKVLVLPFPEKNEGTHEEQSVTFAGNPTFFDHTQLVKRFIPIDEFVNAITRIMNSINADLDKQVALEQTAETSGWNIL
jgi:hypothetical protein